jgi:hypothetical protein
MAHAGEPRSTLAGLHPLPYTLRPRIRPVAASPELAKGSSCASSAHGLGKAFSMTSTANSLCSDSTRCVGPCTGRPRPCVAVEGGARVCVGGTLQQSKSGVVSTSTRDPLSPPTLTQAHRCPAPSPACESAVSSEPRACGRDAYHVVSDRLPSCVPRPLAHKVPTARQGVVGHWGLLPRFSTSPLCLIVVQILNAGRTLLLVHSGPQDLAAGCCARPRLPRMP